MANPSVVNGHIDIANELAERFARLALHGEDWRILWVVLRQTWGWKDGDRKKDFDWISLSQFQQRTGMQRPNVVRVLRRLVAGRLLLHSKQGYGINQNYDEWVVAHRLLGSSHATTPVAQKLPKPVAHTLPTKDKKDTSTKDRRPDEKELTDEQIRQMEMDFKRISVDQQWCDIAYACKTWDQSRQLRTDNRREFCRKVLLMIAWSRLPKMLGRAKLLFHEISGFVNDRGAMERVIDDQEIARRRAFAEEESGKQFVEQELDPQ